MIFVRHSRRLGEANLGGANGWFSVNSKYQKRSFFIRQQERRLKMIAYKGAKVTLLAVSGQGIIIID